MDRSTITASTFNVRPVGNSSGTDAGGAVDATVSYDDTTNTATLTPSAPLTHGAAYHVVMTTAIRAQDGKALASGISWTFTVSAPPPPLTVTAAPSGGSTGVNLDAPATLASIRFWKDVKETGTHTARLWSSTGTLLATLPVTGETAGAGWQQANFTTPVPLSANTVYIVSVNANAFFATTRSGLVTPLTSGIAHSAADVKNGVYGSAAGLFPTGSFGSTNYFVDVVVR